MKSGWEDGPQLMAACLAKIPASPQNFANTVGQNPAPILTLCHKYNVISKVTKSVDDPLCSFTVRILLQASFHKASVVGEERPIVVDHSLKLRLC